MKTEREIKILLSGITNPELSDDLEIRQAWEQLCQDPELMRWFESQRDFDQRVKTALSDSAVPAGLEQEILEQTSFARLGKKSSVPAWLSARWTGWAAAAAILVFAGLFLFKDTVINNQDTVFLSKWSSMEKEDNFRDAMAVFVDDTLINLDFFSEDRDSIKQWLVGQGGSQLQSFPESVEDLSTLGCKTLRWKGKKVSLVCFHYDDKRILHLFVMDRKGTGEALIQNLEGMRRVRNLETGGWLTPTHAVMLVGSDPKVKVSPFFDQTMI